MRKTVVVVLGMTMALLGSGCATITRGTTEAWVVESEPSGAEVRLSTGQTCRTPCTLELKRKNSFGVEISKQGYERVSTQVVSTTAGAGAAGMAGNVLFGGLIGVGVDAASGATKELKPNPLVVKLVGTEAAPAASSVAPASSAAPAASGTTVASTGAEAPVQETASAATDAQPQGDGYADEAAAFAAQYQCSKGVTLKEKDGDREVYAATCPSRNISIECWSGMCRML